MSVPALHLCASLAQPKTIFVPRPLPDFISQLWGKIISPQLQDKIWEWHGNEATPKHCSVLKKCNNDFKGKHIERVTSHKWGNPFWSCCDQGWGWYSTSFQCLGWGRRGLWSPHILSHPNLEGLWHHTSILLNQKGNPCPTLYPTHCFRNVLPVGSIIRSRPHLLCLPLRNISCSGLGKKLVLNLWISLQQEAKGVRLLLVTNYR